jgi:hypothetical protein
MFSRLLIWIGLGLVIGGLCWPFIQRIGLGHLPGDIVIRGKSFRLYFPIATCLAISAFITLISWLFRR